MKNCSASTWLRLCLAFLVMGMQPASIKWSPDYSRCGIWLWRRICWFDYIILLSFSVIFNGWGSFFRLYQAMEQNFIWLHQIRFEQFWNRNWCLHLRSPKHFSTALLLVLTAEIHVSKHISSFKNVLLITVISIFLLCFSIDTSKAWLETLLDIIDLLPQNVVKSDVSTPKGIFGFIFKWLLFIDSSLFRSFLWQCPGDSYHSLSILVSLVVSFLEE